MIPFLSFPTAPVTPSAPVAPTAGFAVQQAAVHIPPSAVAPALSSLSLRNETRGGTNPFAPPLSPSSTLPIAANQNRVFSYQPGATVSARISSPFVAQLLAQAANPGEASSLAAIFVNQPTPTDTLDSRLIERFSLVKYLPSNAALPKPQPGNILAIDRVEAQAEAVRPPIRVPLPARQSPPPVAQAEPVVRQPVAIPTTRQQAETISFSAPLSPVVREQPRHAAPTPAPARPGGNSRISFTSIARPSGADAYLATFSRNAAFIAAVRPASTAIS